MHIRIMGASACAYPNHRNSDMCISEYWEHGHVHIRIIVAWICAYPNHGSRSMSILSLRSLVMCISKA